MDSHRLGYEARCRQQGEASVRVSQGHQDIRYQLNMDNHRVGYEIKILRNRKTPMRVSVSVASVAVEIPNMNLWCAAGTSLQLQMLQLAWRCKLRTWVLLKPTKGRNEEPLNLYQTYF